MGKDVRAGAGTKKLRCRIGFHSWVTNVREGATYLTCRHCGKYADRNFAVLHYRDPRR
jgi:hypothetical protein